MSFSYNKANSLEDAFERPASAWNVRDTLLTMVVLLSLLVNLVFAIVGLENSIGLYALLIYLLGLAGLRALVDSNLLTESDLREARDSHVYPLRVRIPMRAQFMPMVAFWLGWWLVSQLFASADILYERTLFLHLALLAVLLAHRGVLTLYRNWRRLETALLALLALLTLIALFVPTDDWAPQHTSPLHTVVRAVLYFALVLLLDHTTPPTRHAELIGPRERREQASQQLADLNRVFNSSGDPEHGGMVDERQLRIECLIVAHERVRAETYRVLGIASQSGWVLVTPLAPLLVLLPLVFLLSVLRKRVVAVVGKRPPPPTQQPVPAQPLVAPAPAPTPASLVQQYQQRAPSMYVQAYAKPRSPSRPPVTVPSVMTQPSASNTRQTNMRETRF